MFYCCLFVVDVMILYTGSHDCLSDKRYMVIPSSQTDLL